MTEGPTDLILRLVPLFQIPVPQDHLQEHKTKHKSFTTVSVPFGKTKAIGVILLLLK